MGKKTWNTLAADILVAVMTSSVIIGCQREQSIAVQAIDIQAERVSKVDTGTTGESKGSGDVHGANMIPTDSCPVSSLTITYPVGTDGGTDLLSRAMAPAMEEHLGVSVMVVNKPGGGFIIGYAIALQNSNDDSSTSVAFSELLGLPYVADISFDYTDFEPICNFNSAFGALSVNSSVPYDTVEEFAEYCKVNPNTVRIGNSGIDGAWHILAVPFAQETGIEVVHVSFDGGGSAAVATADNNVKAVSVSAQKMQTCVEGGMVKILCSFSPERLSELPDVPTDTECGHPAQMMMFRGLLAPKGMSEDAKAMIDAVTGYTLADETVREFMKAQNYTNNYINADKLKGVTDRGNVVCVEQPKTLGIAVK